MKGLYHISFASTQNPPYNPGDIVRVFYDEVEDKFIVTLNGEEITTGPNLGPNSEFLYPPFFDPYLQVNWWLFTMNDSGDVDFFTSPYQFCELTTLVNFASDQQWPYAKKVNNANHPSCAGNVCNIIFRGTPQIIQPSENTTPDGEIKIVAESTLGIVKYGFENVPYANMPNTTGIFTGLMAGQYTIFAKDAQGCATTIVVRLTAIFNYNVKWWLQYVPVSKSSEDVVYPTRIEILEKNYAGDPIEVKAVNESFLLSMRGENKPIFTTILSTGCVLQLLSERNLQFLEAFTQNDRKFQLRYYKNFGIGFTELWRGWIKPGLYRESYTDSFNYAVSFEATDATANFSKLKFADADGNQISGLNKVITLIATILKKTGLDLPIHVADNLYETTMAKTSSDDPLDQTWIIPDDVFSKDAACDFVLQNLLGTKGARIVQWAKAWWIIRVDEMVAEVTYRIFSKDGVLQSNDTYTPIRNISDKPGDGEFTWINANQGLEIYPAVGNMVTRHNLKKVPNGIKNGGFDKIKFDTIYFESLGQVQKSFKITEYVGWSLVLNGSNGGYPYISGASGKDLISGNGEATSTSRSASLQNALNLYKENRITKSEYDSIVARITKDDVPNYAMRFGGGTSSVYGQDTYVISDVQKVTYSSQDGMKFGFDYYPDSLIGYPTQQLAPPFIKFKFSFKLDDTYYLQADGSWTTDADLEWIEVNVPSGKYKTWSRIEIAALFPVVSGTIEGTYVVKIMHGSFPSKTWTIPDETTLRAVPTVNLPVGYRVAMSFVSGHTTIYRFYELISSTAADSSPGLIRPNDYGTFNPPAYSSLTTYARGAKVKDGPLFFISTHNNNKGNLPGVFSTDHWLPMSGNVIWKMTDEIVTGISETPGFYGMNVFYASKFDNATLDFYPVGEQAPEFKDFTLMNDVDVDNDITEEYAIGDAPVDIRNSKNMYQNIYLREDGTNTIWWARKGQDEKQQLLALLSKQYVEQLQRPRFKLTGDLSGYVNFIDSFSEKGKKFIPMGIEIRDYANETTIDMIELTAPGQNNGFNLGEFNNSEFGTDFDI